jgi:hypothetical protein
LAELRPRRAIGHKFLQEQRRRHRARKGSAAVRRIGDVAVEHVIIGLPQWHPPHRIAAAIRRIEQRTRQRIVIGE